MSGHKQPFTPFDPPHWTYGAGAGRQLIMEVVNRDDPEQSGRLQCRVFGWQDDKANIPDSDLIWARPTNGITNPMNGGIGVSPTGAMVNTVMFGHFMDGSQQLIYTGSIGKAGMGASEGGQLNTGGRNHDTPIAARDQRAGGRVLRFDSDTQKHDDVSVPEFARSKANNQFGSQQSPHSDEQSWSLGYHEWK
jgi:hypothetical protein